MRINFSNACEGFRILLAHLWCLINFDYCYHCQIIITIISNKCAIPRAVSFTCERRAHFFLSSYHKYCGLGVAQGAKE